MTVTILTAAGTWSSWDAGYPADVARTLTSDFDDIHAEVFGLDGPRFRWQPIGYPAVGFLVPDPHTSYRESRAAGINEAVLLGRRANGPVALIGYSQGADVVVRAADLLHAQGVCVVAVITFGSPCRRPGATLIGNDPGGSGISRYYGDEALWPVTFDYTLPGDMYSNAPDDTFLPEFYDLLIDMELSLPFATSVLRFIGRLFEPGGSDADALQRRLSLEPRRVARTVQVVTEFLSTNAHVAYHVPRPEFGGRSAVAHAADVLDGLV